MNGSNKIRYRLMSVNRPIIVHRGVDGQIRDNEIVGFTGEWVTFPLHMNEDVAGELRLPLQEAMEAGLVIAADRIRFTPEEIEEMNSDGD